MADDSKPLDNTDLRILELLQDNARRTFGDIGATVGLSAPAVKRRIDRLEQSGVGILRVGENFARCPGERAEVVIKGVVLLGDDDYMGDGRGHELLSAERRRIREGR